MDRKQSKKEYKRSRSRSEKSKKKRERKTKTKKRRDKHGGRKQRSSSRSSSSSSSLSEVNRSQSSSYERKINSLKIIPIAHSITTKQTQVQNQDHFNGSSNPSSLLNKQGTQINSNGGNILPIREKRNVFSSPPKQVSATPSSVIQQQSNQTQSSNQPQFEIVPNYHLGGTNIIQYDGNNSANGSVSDQGILGNKIPPHLQKNYIDSLRVYIGNIPDSCDHEHICGFVFQQLSIAGGLLEPGNPIVGMRHDPIKKYIFLNLRSIEETTACLDLDGVLYRGKSLRFRRPQNYGAIQKVEGTRPVPQLDRSKLRIVQTQVENTYNKIQIMNLPEKSTEEQVMQILSSYGTLKSFHLAVDKITSESKGIAFCEFLTDRSTFECIQQLNGYSVQNKILAVKRSNQNLAPPNEEAIYSLEQLHKNLIESINKSIIESGQKDLQDDYVQKIIAKNIPKYDGLISSEATTVLKISNIVDKQVIEEDAEYELVFNDLKQQLERIGKVKQIIMPRKKDKFREGIGFAYVEFESEKIAQIASFLISKLKYDGREVKTEFYRPQFFADKTFF